MTDPMKHSDKSNGPLSPSLTRHGVNVKQVVPTQQHTKIKSKIDHGNPTNLSSTRHKRSHSDGDILLYQRKQVQFHPPTDMISCPSKQAHFSIPEKNPTLPISQSKKVSNQKSSQQWCSKFKVMVSTASQTSCVLETQHSKDKQDRKFATESHLKCDLQRKVKTLEQRLQSALKQVRMV